MKKGKRKFNSFKKTEFAHLVLSLLLFPILPHARDLFNIFPLCDLAAYYPFNGNAQDESGNSHHGIVNGATLTTDRFGNANSAYQFAASNNFIELPVSDLLGDKPSWTFSAFYFLDNTTTRHSFYGEYSTAGNTKNYIYLQPGEGINHDNFLPFDSDFLQTPISAGVWNHLAMVRDNDFVKVYINGILADEKLYETYEGTTPTIAVLGNRLSDDTPFQPQTYAFSGKLDDVKIFDRALSDLEIADLFNSQSNIVYIDQTTCDPNQVGQDTLQYYSGCELITEITVYSLEDNTLDEDLIAYYSFNGNTNDESGNGNHGTNSGATPSADRFGNPQSAYFFNGSSNYLFIPNTNEDFNTQQFTISAWIKWEAGAICCGGGGIFDVVSEDENIDYYALTAHGNFFRSWINYPFSSSPEFVYDTTVLQDNAFHHLVSTYNGSIRKLFLDGMQVSEGVFSETIPYGSGTKAYIGVDYPGGDDYFRGTIDELAVYSRALLPSEITTLYHQGMTTCSDCSNITDVPAGGELAGAVSCLCTLGYIKPQPHSANNFNGVIPEEEIYRADLAKLIYYTVYKGDAPAPSDSFPVPFLDLQNDKDPYYRYAKALSYLEYDDGVAPFDRHFANFRPYDPIERRYALKVLLEAYDIAPDPSNGGPIMGLEVGDDAYGYVHRAYDMQLVETGNATDNMLRQDMFVILHRLLSSCGPDCAAGCMSPDPEPGDYYVPGNFSPFNLGRNIGLAEGYFQNFNTTSFDIPGIQLPLNFTHLYNSYLTLIPDTITYLRPLGEGWSHSYNSYITKESGWTGPEGTILKDYFLVFWPNGAVHSYDAATMLPESHGVYDEMTQPDPSILIIRKLNQIQFVYERFVLPSGREIFMLHQIIDRNNNMVTITNESAVNPRIKRVTGTAGRVLEFHYDAPGSNHITSVQDLAGGREIHFSVDDENNLEYYVNPRGDTTFYNYDLTQPAQLHLLEKVQMPRGNTVTSTYDAQRKLQSVQYPGVNSLRVETSADYANGSGINSTVTDQTGTAINYDFDAYGYAISKSIGDKMLSYGRKHPGDPSLPTLMDYEGFASRYTYNDKGQILQIDLPMDVSHKFTYTSLNDIATYTDPRNDTTTYHYDGNGNIDMVIDNMGFVTDFTVNDIGQVKQIENPENIVQTFNYDSQGNLQSILAPLGILTTFEYDPIGRMTRMTNPKGQVTEYAYDPLDLVLQQTRKSAIDGDIITRYSYDKNSNLDTITNALDGKTIYTYNERDLLSSTTFGDDSKQYSYRDDGLLDTYTKPDNTLFQYGYDELGRLETDGFAGYVYDDQDNITRITHNGQGLDMTYDSLNRITTVTYDSRTVGYTQYDKNGNLEMLTYPDGLVVQYTYDKNNRLTTVQWNSETVTYDYFKDGRLQQVNYGNGTYTTYGYDAAGRMTNLANVKSNTSDTICAYHFVLDPLGNHLEEQRTEPFGDPTLADLNLSNQYNAENEIQSSGSTTFSFDANGNRTAKDDLTSSWDDRDMLLSIGTIQYSYDGMGLRRTVSENGALTKKYIWDVRGMGNVLAETDVAGTIQYYYIHGLGLCARVNAQTGAVHYYHYDFRGSTIAMTDAGENITHQYSYLPFGELVQETETDANPFKYVGQYGVMAEGEDLYYMRARYMDARTGRFLSEDPVWGENLFLYANNNPITRNDPKGTSDFLATFFLHSIYHVGDAGLRGLISSGGKMIDAYYNYKYGNYGEANKDVAESNEILSNTFKRDIPLAFGESAVKSISGVIGEVGGVLYDPAITLLRGGLSRENIGLAGVQLASNVVSTGMTKLIKIDIGVSDKIGEVYLDDSFDFGVGKIFETIEISYERYR